MSHEKSVLFLSGLIFAFIIFMVSTMVVDTFKMLNVFSTNSDITSENNSIFVEESLSINSSLIEESEIISVEEPTSEIISTEEPTSEIINPYPTLSKLKYYTVPMKRNFNYPETYSYFLVDSYAEYLSLYHDSAFLTIKDNDIPIIEESFFIDNVLVMFTILEDSPAIRNVSRKDERVHFSLNDKSDKSWYRPSLYIVELSKDYISGALNFTAYVKYKEYDNDIVFTYKELSYNKIETYDEINDYEVFLKDDKYCFFYNKKDDTDLSFIHNNYIFKADGIDNIYFYDFSINIVRPINEFSLINTYIELLHKYFYYNVYIDQVLKDYHIKYNKDSNYIYETTYLDENNNIYMVFTFLNHNDLGIRYLDFEEFVLTIQNNTEILIYHNNDFIDLMSAYENGLISILQIKEIFYQNIQYKF